MSGFEPWNLEDFNEAECSRSFVGSRRWGYSGEFHPVPVQECTCGFWAYRSYELMVENVELDIYGVVALGGAVVDHTLGYRAKLARVVALLDTDKARRFKQAYEQPVVARPQSILSDEGGRIGSVRGSPGRAGRILPVPLLSAALCELLAMDEGCVFEPEPPRIEVPEIGQYLVKAGGHAYEIASGKHQEYEHGHAFVFAPPDQAPPGSLRVDKLLGAPGPNDLHYAVMHGPDVVHLRRTVIRRADGPDVLLWALPGSLHERDEAFGRAVKKYGYAWLDAYAVR